MTTVIDIEDIYRTHRSRFVNSAHYLVGDRGLAEQVVAEAFTKAWANRGRWQDRGIAPAGWVQRIVTNEARGLRRSHGFWRCRPAGDDLPEPSTSCVPTSAEVVERAELVAEVRAAVRQLPDRLRRAVVLRFWHDMSPADIAQELGITHASARSLVCRAYAALRPLLAGTREAKA